MSVNVGNEMSMSLTCFAVPVRAAVQPKIINFFFFNKPNLHGSFYVKEDGNTGNNSASTNTEMQKI